MEVIIHNTSTEDDNYLNFNFLQGMIFVKKKKKHKL